jgi:nucleoside-diphosphate-sugar epimerase
VRVLVVGGTRFLGLHVVWRLLALGHAVTLFNRGTRADPFGARVERARGDRTAGDLGRWLRGRRFDAVVDLAAYEARDAEEVVHDLDGGHYVVISTGQVYLVREGCPRPAREEDYEGPLLPEPPRDHADHREWAYGMGKRGVEDALSAAPGLPSTRLRIPMVNGPGDYLRRLEGYLWRLTDGGPLVLPDGGGHRLRHVYVADVAAAVVALLGREAAFGRAYNLCQPETPTLVEVLRLVAGLLGGTPRLVAVPRAAPEAAGLDPVAVSPFSGRWMSFLEPGRAERELGFRATPLEAYLRVVVDAFLSAAPAEPPPAYAGRAREVELAGRAPGA